MAAGTNEVSNEKSQREQCCLADPLTSTYVFACVFLGILITAFLMEPSNLLQIVLLYIVPDKPDCKYAILIGAGIAVLMMVPVPLIFMILLVPGMVFGFEIGMVILLCGLLVGVSTAFCIGRWAFQDAIRDCIQQGDSEKAKLALKILETDEDSFLLLVLFRFLMMPFFAKNFGVGILRIPLWKLILSAIPHHLWVAFVFASLGSVFKDSADLLRKGGKMDWNNLKWQNVAGPIAGIIGSVLIGVIAYRIYQRREEAHSNERSEATPLMGGLRA
mmetsp:Transcript_81904/g.208155  ORF Transcript_81904/g.208155 Transcript_81904/m.208155 type:complete len:274 (+) Transcript_81904:94-915(+)|eukprot:CAMPEP_0183414472 /NCGR_PEP_ID=MMETSP0370-20130417/22413_1 /TAXON_ID=268820 /ORGANISM="Peridinium aciculiferum, Strain PAER-2" /LENGTH=273 /DNA_ID=CAMNT_0025597797 /DNA_START=95 /DNA_END=916 /DNA_ORIENTATION=+